VDVLGVVRLMDKSVEDKLGLVAEILDSFFILAVVGIDFVVLLILLNVVSVEVEERLNPIFPVVVFEVFGCVFKEKFEPEGNEELRLEDVDVEVSEELIDDCAERLVARFELVEGTTIGELKLKFDVEVLDFG